MRTPTRLPVVVAVVVSLLAACGLAAVPAAASGRGGVEWSSCRADAAAEMRCAVLRVPADWARPWGRSVSLRLAKLPATGSGMPLGSVLFAPGGPGSSGISQIEPERFDGLRERFDVVTWEPRGSWEHWDDPACKLTGPRYAAPRTAREYRELGRANRAAMAPCRSLDPVAFENLDSASNARDMDAIRRALGERQLNLVGLSYGGVFVTTYARLFPQRVRTSVLDSGVNHVTRPERFEPSDYAILEDRFRSFVDWCAETATCRQRGEDLPAWWRMLVRRADRSPIPVRGSEPEVAYTGVDLELTIGTHLHHGWYQQLSDALDRAARGDASGFAASFGGGRPWFPSVSMATQCADGFGFAGYGEYRRAVTRGRRSSENFPRYRSAYRASSCAGWRQVANPPGRPPRAAPPPLVAASQAELHYARMLVADLPGSVLVTVEGDEHGPYSVFGNPCLTGLADSYLLTGELPESATCPPTTRP